MTREKSKIESQDKQSAPRQTNFAFSLFFSLARMCFTCI